MSTGAITGSGLTPEMAVVPTKNEYVAIVSHDCEFNEGKRKHFLVARIDDLSSKLTDEELEDLRLGNDVLESVEAGRQFPLDTFVLEPIAGVFERPRRINFCTMTPYSIAAVDEMRAMKKAELDHPTRVLLRQKIGLFFGRETEDMPDDEKTDPATVRAADAEK